MRAGIPICAIRPCLEGWLSHTGQATGLADSTSLPSWTTVAGQCRDLTGLRWVCATGYRRQGHRNTVDYRRETTSSVTFTGSPSARFATLRTASFTGNM